MTPAKLSDITLAVCHVFDVTPQDLKRPRNVRHQVSEARSAAFLVARNRTQKTFEVIADHFGSASANSAYHSYRRGNERVKSDPAFEQKIFQVKDALEDDQLLKGLQEQDRAARARDVAPSQPAGKLNQKFEVFALAEKVAQANTAVKQRDDRGSYRLLQRRVDELTTFINSLHKSKEDTHV